MAGPRTIIEIDSYTCSECDKEVDIKHIRLGKLRLRVDCPNCGVIAFWIKRSKI